MMSWQMHAIVVAALAGHLIPEAAQADCYYGEGRYTYGATLCQSGQSMQCVRGEGGSVWESLDRQCAASAIVDAAQVASNETRRTISRDPSDDMPVDNAAAAKAGRSTSDAGDEPATPDDPVTRVPANPGSGTAVIDILWAEYGRDGQNCDAAAALTERCDGEGGCEVTVNPDALCGDPVPGRPKLLSVYWRCSDGSTFMRQPARYGQDGSRISLQCNAGQQ